jgi:hypothetical protein
MNTQAAKVATRGTNMMRGSAPRSGALVPHLLDAGPQEVRRERAEEAAAAEGGRLLAERERGVARLVLRVGRHDALRSLCSPGALPLCAFGSKRDSR